MRCPNCDELLEDDAKFCGYCGYLIKDQDIKTKNDVVEVRQLNGQESLKNIKSDKTINSEFSGIGPEIKKGIHDEENPKTNKKEKQEKKWWKRVVAVCVVLFLAGGVGFWLWYQSDTQRFERAMKQDEFAEAKKFYDDLSPEKKQKADERLTERAHELYNAYNREEISYEKAEEELEVLVENYALDLIQEIAGDLEGLRNSKQSYAQAEQEMENGKYKNAIMLYETVLEEDSRFSSAQERMQEALKAYKNQVVSQSQELLEKGDFAEAERVLNEGTDILEEDEELQNLRQEISEKEEQAMAEQLIAEAQAYAAEGDYVNAISALEQSLSTGYGSEEILEEYKAAYRQQFLDIAQSYADAGEYDKAIAELNQGINYFGEENNFIVKREEYKNKLPVALVDSKVVDKRSVSAYQAAEDIFGNIYQNYLSFGGESYIEYSPNGNYKYLKGTIFVVDYSDADKIKSIQIYADEALVYDSGILGLKNDPLEIDIDISNAKFVKIVSNEFYYTGSMYLGFANAQFHN